MKFIFEGTKIKKGTVVSSFAGFDNVIDPILIISLNY